MPSVDIAELKRLISLKDVLELLGCTVPAVRRGPLRGPCPYCKHPDRRCLSAWLPENRWHCFRCHQGGDQIDLYQLVTRRNFLDVVNSLAAARGVPVPYVPRRRPPPSGEGDLLRRGP